MKNTMKNKHLKFLLFGVIVSTVMGCQQKTTLFNILDFGAVGDSLTVNTKAINIAIEEASEKGGGTVVIPPGTFISGTVILLSNVNLHFEPGSKLVGSKDTSDYLLMDNALFKEGYNHFGLIYSVDAVHVSITGTGEINGNGTYFMNGLDKPHIGGDFDRKFTRQGNEFMKQGTVFEDGPVSYAYRPGMMITFERCENIHISDVTLKDTPEWTLRIGDCDNANVEGISILNNPLIPNSDGINCSNSRNIRISDCNIIAGDDAIIVNGWSDQPSPNDSAWNVPSFGNKTGYSENVTVTNCVLSSRSACIRVGAGYHPMRNLAFSNLVTYNSNRGIIIIARDNGPIENVLFSNIIINTRLYSGHWWGKGEPIQISSVPATKNGKPGIINNIRFSNITATSEAGVLIYGTENSVIDNICLENIKLTINKGKYTESYGGNFDLRPASPLDIALFKHDIPGLYAQYVKHLTVTQFELSWGAGLPSFFTNALEINHFRDILLEGIDANPAPNSKGLSAIMLREGTNAVLRSCSTNAGAVLIKKEMVK
jgi:polygalacturonase